MIEKNSISIIIPSIKPHLWEAVINHYKSNTVHVEIIFIGPKECNFPLPERVKFIKTDFKVAQCIEIGMQHATSFYLLQAADDTTIEGSSDPLGDIVRASNSFPDKIISLGIAFNGRKLTNNQKCLVSNHPETNIPFCLVLTKAIISQVGGYNANYIASYVDVDLYLRILKSTKLCQKLLNNIYINEDRTEDDNLGLLSFRYLGHDIKYLKYNWLEYNSQTKSYFLRNKSREDFQPFNQNILLTEEQGAGKAKIFKSKYFILMMRNKFFRYAVLLTYKFYRKFILRAKFY